jgi:hypothetical protein
LEEERAVGAARHDLTELTGAAIEKPLRCSEQPYRCADSEWTLHGGQVERRPVEPGFENLVPFRANRRHRAGHDQERRDPTQCGKSATAAEPVGDRFEPRVWPWLVQMGGGRGGWYSWSWLDTKGSRARTASCPSDRTSKRDRFSRARQTCSP